MERFIGKMLDGRYEIKEIIGVGGMAVVFKAKCHRLNRYVAIKILKDEYMADDELRRQFHEESQAVAMLSHPNIMAVYDVSKTEELEYIVMELIDGITLKEYLERRGPLSSKEVTIFSTQIAKALEHAHSREIIHRDIKPQNIMLLRDGTLKVADFGIAHIANSQINRAKGEAIGSVHYVSPEQAKGSDIDNRADLYSLGVVMYEMLTGRLPFEGETPVEVALQHIRSIPLSPSERVEGIPETLERITMKAMNPHLSRRYASATEILADLEAFRNDANFKIDLPDPTPLSGGEESALDATRKFTNPSQAVQELLEEKKRAEQESDDDDDKVVSRTLIFSIAAVLLFFIGAIYFVVSVINPFGTNEGEKLLAPNLINKNYRDVIDDSLYADFILVEGEMIYDENLPAGTIIAQTPAPGRSVGADKKITLTISRGAKSMTLGEYANWDIRQVKIVLDRNSIPYVLVEEFSNDVAKNMVIRTEPAAGTSVTADTTVTIFISKGLEPIEVLVPNLIGMTEIEAFDALQLLGLELGDVVVVESTYPVGQIIFQEIPASSMVLEGTAINVQVSKGSGMAVVPDLLGKTEAEALALLNSAELRKGSVTPVYSSKPAGTIVTQSVVAGTEVDKNTAISFSVSLGVESGGGTDPGTDIDPGTDTDPGINGGTDSDPNTDVSGTPVDPGTN